MPLTEKQVKEVSERIKRGLKSVLKKQPEIIEDLVNDVWADLLTCRWPNLDEDGQRAYAFLAAQNTAKSWLRDNLTKAPIHHDNSAPEQIGTKTVFIDGAPVAVKVFAGQESNPNSASRQPRTIAVSQMNLAVDPDDPESELLMPWDRVSITSSPGRDLEEIMARDQRDWEIKLVRDTLSEAEQAFLRNYVERKRKVGNKFTARENNRFQTLKKKLTKAKAKLEAALANVA